MRKENLNKKTIRCGLIGLGTFGVNYLRLLRDMEGVTLVVVANANDTAFEVHKNLLAGIKTTTNAADIFADKSIDAVFIVTPSSTHYELIQAGLRAGKHVFVEKPMVLNVSDAKKLTKLAKKSGRVFMVGYQYLFNDTVAYVKQEIEKGTLGKILSIKSEHVLLPIRQDTDVFWDAAPHPLSIFEWICDHAKLISAEGKIEHENASVKIEFENAPTLEILARTSGEVKVRKLTFVGEKGTVIIDETLPENKVSIQKNGLTSSPKIPNSEPLRNELEHFLMCIKTGDIPRTNINFGYKITEWLEIISKRLR